MAQRVEVVLSDEEREVLERWAGRPKSSQALALPDRAGGGGPERRTHDYVRNGTTNPYAALNVASGQVIAEMTARHRAEELRRFLNLIERSVSAHFDVHVVLDNSGQTPS